MKRNLIIRSILLIVVPLSTFILSSCVEPDDSLVQSTEAVATSIDFPDASGVLDAITSVTYMTVAGINIPVETKTAFAAFHGSSGDDVLLDAGLVTINSKSLTKNGSNSYVYQDIQSPLDFSSIYWQVDGKDSIPMIAKNITNPVPAFTGYSSLPSTISKANGLTLDISGEVTGADSVYMVITDVNSNWILKRTGGATSSINVTTEELNKLTKGKAMIQITVFNYELENISNRKFYFINQSTYSKVDASID